MSSGLDAMASDMFVINETALLAFVQAVLQSMSWENKSYLLLARGPLVHLIALLRATMPSAMLPNMPDKFTDDVAWLLRHCFRTKEPS